MSDLVESLRERAANARTEGNATANADAWHFEKSADEIERLRAVNAELVAALLHAKANMPHPDQMIDDALAKAKDAA